MQLTWLQPFGLAVTGIQLTTVRPARAAASYAPPALAI
jgi:hypothetical protein